LSSGVRYSAHIPLPYPAISLVAARHMTVRLICSGNHVSLFCDSPAFDRRRVLDVSKLAPLSLAYTVARASADQAALLDIFISVAASKIAVVSLLISPC
jgi:hypothetical protein